MKIAYIATSTIPSSTANSMQVMKVCQALTQNGEDVHLYVPGKGKPEWDILSKNYGVSSEFPITRVPSWKGFKRLDFSFSALQQARKEKVDVVYTRMLWVAVGAQQMNLPVILELHDLPVGRFGPRLFYKYLFHSGKKLTVCITSSLKNLLENQFSIRFNPSEILISPDGVDLERYQNLPDQVEARRKLGFNNVLTAAYSGGFYEGRGLETLQELASKFPKVQFLWIGGKGDVIVEWKKKLASMGLENVHLTGFIPNADLPLYQAAADILLMPYGKVISGSSGGNIAAVSSPMKMFEYMASGRVILTSNLSVLREILSEENAIFYEPENNNDLFSKFSMLIEDEGKRIKLGEQARKDVLQYSWQERMKRIILYLNENKC